MGSRILRAAMLAATLTTAAQAGECAATRPPATAFVPPSPYPESAHDGFFWTGSEELWTMAPERSWPATVLDGKWRVKMPWFVAPSRMTGTTSDSPRVQIKARRLDGSPTELQLQSGPLSESRGMAFFPSVLALPSGGCWELNATWGAATLRITILVGAEPPR